MTDIPDTVDPVEMVVAMPVDADGPSDAGIEGEDYGQEVPGGDDDDEVVQGLEDAAGGEDR